MTNELLERDAAPRTVNPTRMAAELDRRYRAQGSARSLARDGWIVGGWTLAASSVALFLIDKGASYFTTLGGALTGIGIVAGLLATVAMVLQLLLAARVPAIDRAFGQDRALKLHATLGKGMVYGLLAHGLFLVTGYAVSARVTLVAEFLSLWGTADFVWAIVGFGLFTVVGVTSLAIVRRRWPYEAWFGVHLLSYVAIAASIPHQFSMSGMLAPGTIGRPFWIAMWLVTAFCLLAFRVFLPLFTSLSHQLKVSRVVPEGPDAYSIEFTGRHLDRLEARGGNWLTWRFLTPGMILTPHPFSLSADPTHTSMRITVRALGEGTRRLASVKPGTRVAVEGPYGMFTDAARTRSKVVMVGAGIGIAPVRAFLETTSFAPGEAVVVLRASTPDELYLAEEVRRLAVAKGAILYHLVGRRAGDTWVDESHAGLSLRTLAPWVADADVYFCGPDAWMDAVERDARACGVPAEQIHDERFSW